MNSVKKIRLRFSEPQPPGGGITFHRRGAEHAEGAQSRAAVRFSLRDLCALCVSAVKASYQKAALAATLLLLLTAWASAQTIKLEPGWQFLADKSGTLQLNDLPQAQGWRSIRAGLSWNAQFSDLRDYQGVAWYRTKVNLPPLKADQTALLRFGAVDYLSQVYLNGQKAGEHEGGYLPFTLDVGKLVKAGENEIVVRVIDPDNDKARWGEMNFGEIPHGKQGWYVQTGGIWQPVSLEIKPKHYITGVHVTPKNDGSVWVDVYLGPPPPAHLPTDGFGYPSNYKRKKDDPEVRVIDPSGKALELRPGSCTAGIHCTYYGKLANPKLWGLNHPNLYNIEVRWSNGDFFTDRFGFRSFEARDGKLYLNGEPIYIISALDQDFYPEGIYTPPSYEFLLDQMRKAKALGLNLLRTHIKVPTPDYLRAADEVGMLVWYEIPSWDENLWTPAAAKRGEQIFQGELKRDWNHPSIVIQSIVNEAWGVRNLKEDQTRAWLKSAFNQLKPEAAKAGHLVVDNSACCENFHLKTDIADFHQYYSIPDRSRDWDKWVADYATRPAWLWSKYGDAEPTGREPLVVSEFGNWGLPKLPEKLPWWFDRDFGGREVTRPAGVLARFQQFKFDRLFSDFNTLAVETQWHQFISLKHEIEEIRRYTSIQGYTITEFTDINWEVNGLMDMWRHPKVYAAELAKIQQPDVILARLPKRNYAAGERVEIPTLISHYSGKELNGARVLWSLASGARGSFEISRSIPSAGVETLPSISLTTPLADHLLRDRLLVEVRGRDGSRLAENSYDLFVFPKAVPAKEARLTFHDPAKSGGNLASALAAAGYQISTTGMSSDSRALMIATQLDSQVERHLQSGGRAVILVNSKEALPAGWSLKATPRAGSDLNGNWVTNFNWIRADAPPFKAVAFTKLLGFESAEAVPQYVIQGVASDHYDDVLAGIFYGWLNRNAALAVQFQTGQGQVFATTFRFDEYGRDPYATHLLDAIIGYTSGSEFAPKLKISGQ